MTNNLILNLRFYYKGKNIDTAKEDRDIKKRFVVGSDKYIHWQILDKSFPKKHVLIRRVKDGFKLVLHKGMQLTVKKGEEILTEDMLREQKLLKNRQLYLDRESVGYVTCAKYWCIAYEFVEAEKRVVSAEDKMVIQRYYRRPPLDPQEKLSRNLFIIAVLLTLVGAFLFENFYQAPVYERSLAQRVQIEPAVIQPEETLVFEEIIPEDIPEVIDDRVDRPVGAVSILGFDPDAISGPVVSVPRGPAAITYSEQIVASGSGVTGEGPPRTTGGRASAAFEAGAIIPESISPGDLFRGDVDTARRHGMRDIDPSLLGGDTDQIRYTHITSGEQLDALVRAQQRALSAGIQTVDESAIETSSPEIREAAINIRQYIEPNIRQIHELFAQETQIRNIYGSMQVTLYFRPDGGVEAVNIEPRPGSFFTESFITRSIDIMSQWRVPTRRQLPAYSFQIRFLRN